MEIIYQPEFILIGPADGALWYAIELHSLNHILTQGGNPTFAILTELFGKFATKLLAIVPAYLWL